LWALVDPFFDGRRLLGVALWSTYGSWFALAFVGYALLFRAVRHRGWPVVLAGVPTLVFVEWRQPQIFPLYAGNGLVAVPLLAQSRGMLADGAVDLVIWPESAYVRGIRRPLPLSGRPIAEDVTVPILFGASSVLEIDGRKVRSNSAFLIGADGMISDVYDKNL